MRLKFHSFAAPGEAYHAGASILGRDSALHPHTHDFHEVFWIASGSGRHECNGVSTPIGPGSLAFIRPSDIHSITTGAEPVCIRNIAFRARSAAVVERSLREGDGSRIFPDGLLCIQTHISATLLGNLNRTFDRLAVNPRLSIPLHAFLFDLVERLISDSPQSPQANPIPDWLSKAVESLRDPEVQSRGLKGFYRLCGRCQEHIARACRKHCGQSPSELLNRHRLERAATLLAATDEDILTIALECGWNNLGHFYQLFKKAHGLSPGKFRKTARRTLPASEA